MSPEAFSNWIDLVVSAEAEVESVEGAGGLPGATLVEGAVLSPNCGLVRALMFEPDFVDGLARGVGDTPGPRITLGGIALGAGTGMYGCL